MFSSQMFTNAKYELRTASMNSHSNALLLDDIIRKSTQHCFLLWHVIGRTLIYHITEAQMLL